MNNLLAQIGLISLCAGLIYILWKLDLYIHEKYEDDVPLKIDEGADD